jgi:hypothetical protein
MENGELAISAFPVVTRTPTRNVVLTDHHEEVIDRW